MNCGRLRRAIRRLSNSRAASCGDIEEFVVGEVCGSAFIRKHQLLWKHGRYDLEVGSRLGVADALDSVNPVDCEVVGEGAEKVLTKNGSSFVAIVDARKLDYYHALEEEHANLVLLDEAETGLRELLAGKRVSTDELMAALADQ